MANYASKFIMEVLASDKTKAVLSNLQNNLTKTGKSGKDSGLSIKGAWGQVAAGFIAAKAAIAGVEGALNALNAGKTEAIVGTAFRSMHANSEALLQQMQKASKYAMDDSSMMVMANKWKASGQDMQALIDAMPRAAKIRAAVGGDIVQITESVAKAMATGKLRQIQEYTGVLDLAAAYKEYEKATGRVPDALEKVRIAADKAGKAMDANFGMVEIDVDVQSLDKLEKQFKDIAGQFSEALMRAVVDAASVAKGIMAETSREQENIRLGIASLAQTNRKETIQNTLSGLLAIERSLKQSGSYMETIRESEEAWMGSTRNAAAEQAVEQIRAQVAGMYLYGTISERTYNRINELISTGVANGLKGKEIQELITKAIGETRKALEARTKAEQEGVAKTVEYIKNQFKIAEDATKAATEARAAETKAAEERADKLAKYAELVTDIIDLETKGRANLNVIEAARLDWLQRQVAAMQMTLTLTERMSLAAAAIGNSEAVKQLKSMGGGLAKFAGDFGGDLSKAFQEGIKPKAPKGGSGGSKPADMSDAMFALRQKEIATQDELEKAAVQWQIDMLAAEEDYTAKRISLKEKVLAEQKATADWEAAAADRTKEALDGVLEAQKNAAETEVNIIKNLHDSRMEYLEREMEARKKALELEMEARKKTHEAAVQSGQDAAQMSMQSENNVARLAAGLSLITAKVDKSLEDEKGNYLAAGIAAGEGAAAVIKSERAKAAIYALMEVARAAASYPDYGAMAAHAAAAVAYGAVAMTSTGGGKAKAKTVYRAPKAATATSGSSGAGSTYHFHIQGIVAGTGREFALETAKLLNDAKGLISLDQGLMSKQAVGL